MIRICAACSELDLNKIEEALGIDQVLIECIGHCQTTNLAYIQEELYEVANAEEVIDKAKELK